MSEAAVRLRAWNGIALEAAIDAILPCNGSRAWAAALAERRPFAEVQELFAAADQVWRMLRASEWQEAFDRHPRIGETQAASASARSLQWSHGEQSEAWTDEAIKIQLREGNRAYEAKFGRIFIVCATSKSSAEILNLLQQRMENDPHAELLEAAEQQRRITQLRLRKWLAMPGVSCDDV